MAISIKAVAIDGDSPWPSGVRSNSSAAMGIPRQVVTNTRSSHTGLRINSRPSLLVDGAPTPSSPETVPVKSTSTWDWRVLLTLLMQSASAEGLVQGRTGTFGELLLVVLGEMASAAKAKVLSHLCDRVEPSGVA